MKTGLTTRARRHAPRGSASVALSLGLAGSTVITVLPATSGAAVVRHSQAQSTLTVAMSDPPVSMDPAHDDNGNGIYTAELAYEPLIWENSNGSLSPGLATSWHYVSGSGGKAFVLTVRQGAKFSDGQPVTPEAVANSLNYFPTGSGPTTADLKGVKASVSGPESVTLTSATPDPIFPTLLSQDYLAGDIVSPAGLGNTKVLAGTPSGAGAYVLDTKETIPGTKYVFTPNPYYYDPSRIHYKEIVIEAISNPTSALEALRTGQVDLDLNGEAEQIPTAKSSGLDVVETGAEAWDGVFLLDRDGSKAKALASPLVRQALNYAVDRPAIARAVFGVLGEADDEPVTPGWDEWVPSLASYYTYDVAKAKKLLAEAGYSSGFTMSLEYAADEAQTQEMVEAVASEWGKIGVRVTLKAEPTISALAADLANARYTAVSLEWGSQPMFLQVGECWLPTSVLNPFHAEQPGFVKEFDAASGAPSNQITSDMQRLSSITIKQGYVVPVADIRSVTFASQGIDGLPTQLPGGHLNLVDVY